MRSLGLGAIASFLCLPFAALGDVEFTTPKPGAKVPVEGAINVKWKESGFGQSIEDLTAYTLVLMVGGNNEGEMLALATFVSQGTYAAGNSAQGTIGSGIAESIPNGFFFQMISASAEGGNVINYSDRFSITGLTGTTDASYRDAATALDGSTQGPSNPDRPSASSSSSSALPTTTAPNKAATSSTSPVTTTPASQPSGDPASGTGNSDDSGLPVSDGALVGIALAGAAVGLLGLGLAIWMCLRRRKRKSGGPTKLNEDADLSREVLAYPKEMSVSQTPVELDPWARVVEADSSTAVAEMDGAHIRAELAGDFIHREPLTPVPDTPLTPMTLRGFHNDSPTPLSPGTPVTPRSNV